MVGIINVLKPPGMTSFNIVSFLRRNLHIKKIGHAGTLDPEAVGVLPVCVGKATKVLEYMTGMDKVYRAELYLGIETNTQDAYGKPIYISDVTVTQTEIIETIKSFIGENFQVPPMYSAVKVKGKKLYELARQGITIERESRKVHISKIENIQFTDKNKVLFDVHCSKGTYIRTLCSDIGKKLGCGAHMSFLLRKSVGPFHIEEAHTLEEIEQSVIEGNPNKFMLDTDFAIKYMDPIVLGHNSSKKILNGRSIEILDRDNNYDGLVRIYNDDNLLIALGEIIVCDGIKVLKPRKILL